MVFTSLLLSNSVNKHLYNSPEHLAELLGSRSHRVVTATLQVLSSLVLQPQEHRQPDYAPVEDSSASGRRDLTFRLMCLAQGYGGKLQGLSLLDCVTLPSEDLPPSGSNIRFGFYVQDVDDAAGGVARGEGGEAGGGVAGVDGGSVDGDKDSGEAGNAPRGVYTNIYVERLEGYEDATCPVDVAADIVRRHAVPRAYHFSVLVRVRRAMAFRDTGTRTEAVRCRLLALNALVVIGSDKGSAVTQVRREREKERERERESVCMHVSS
jgi:hypothetical protein